MKQTGSILVQTLIFLMILGIISATIIQFTESELHTANAYEAQHHTFTEAQRALSVGKIWLAALKARPIIQDQCATLPCVYIFSNSRNFYDHVQWQKLGKSVNSDQATYFMIEQLESLTDSNNITTDYYQITAISWSEKNKSLRLIQSVVSKSFNENDTPLNAFVEQQSWRLS